MVLYVYVTFPGTLAAQRIVVVLNESVDEINSSYGILYPFYVELVPDFKVTGLIVLDQQTKGAFLDIVLSAGGGQFEFLTYLFDGRSVHAVNLPWNLNDVALGILGNLGVQTVGNRSLIGLILNGFVIFFYLGTGDPLIEIAG